MFHYVSLCFTCATSFCPSHLGCRFVKWDLKFFTTSAKLPQRHTFKAQNESELALCWSLKFELDISAAELSKFRVRTINAFKIPLC